MKLNLGKVKKGLIQIAIAAAIVILLVSTQKIRRAILIGRINDNLKLTKGKIISYSRKKNRPIIEYTFSSNSTSYSGTVGVFGSSLNYLGKTFWVAYDSLDSRNHALILYHSNLEEFGFDLSDSIKFKTLPKNAYREDWLGF
ncbi:hypothetical protein [Jiulongibacter sediminis]|uniref:Uncharacterized protein n=1 Tax=Jiulongibacter sediminis TaxID=1605367 RepID=A0A0P7B8Q3_9BACT|nr:hypothetical protein [Jiulongibacter sediminis]KPM46674.1 hypothetical protein AFM12_17975 [Jiulongibacter sediminis]TBX21580.1 hypothetical protein TK44_17980 [Jiulongibacter sediminis]